MTHHPEHSSRQNSPPELMVREQLERILASQTFVRSDRLSAFLRFVVEQQLNGGGANLKEQVLAEELYKRGSSFEGSADPVVRVDARRLRDKLREYYSESLSDPIIISLPKGSYVPTFERNGLTSGPAEIRVSADPTPQRTDSYQKTALTAAVALTIGSAVLIGTMAAVRSRTNALPPRLAPLAAYPWDEGAPALSPDGNTVAFMCPGSPGSPANDLCVKAVGTETSRKLVESPEPESNPAWSPDGREIAFVREGKGIFVVSHLGGPERRASGSGTHVGWTADSRSLLARDRPADGPFRIYRISLDTLEKRALTEPGAGIGDWTFAASPDGSRLAFIRSERPGDMDVYIVPIAGGKPRRITNWRASVSSIVWTPDNRDLIFSASGRLWRISADVSNPARGTAIPDLPLPANMIAISGARRDGSAILAFRSVREEIELRTFDQETPRKDGRLVASPAPAPTTRIDVPGPLSADGTKMAFVSNRASFVEMDLWVARRDGSGFPRKLTSMRAQQMVAGSWSPDGYHIAFDAAVEGNTDIYVVSAEGGAPTRLTFQAGIDGLPAWSADGSSIYFTSTSKGPIPEIWRIPSSGGEPMQITHGGGFQPQCDPDGQYLYYLDRPPLSVGNPRHTSRLLRIPVSGGEPVVLHEAVPAFYWYVSRRGIYFVTADGPVRTLSLLHLDTQKVTHEGDFPFPPAIGPGRLIVSSDGRWVLTSERKRFDADLMMLDNFR